MHIYVDNCKSTDRVIAHLTTTTIDITIFDTFARTKFAAFMYMLFLS